MDRRELPGFFYDARSGRYFPRSSVPPSVPPAASTGQPSRRQTPRTEEELRQHFGDARLSTNSSSSSSSRKNKKQKLDREHAADTDVSKPAKSIKPISRAIVLDHNPGDSRHRRVGNRAYAGIPAGLLGCSLRQEIGAGGASSTAHLDRLAAAMQLARVSRTGETDARSYGVSCWHPETQSLICGFRDTFTGEERNGVAISSFMKLDAAISDDFRGNITSRPTDRAFGNRMMWHTSTLTSIHFMSPQTLFMTTLGGQEVSMASFSTLPNFAAGRRAARRTDWADVSLELRLRSQSARSIDTLWSSAPGRHGQPQIAVGGSHAAYLLDIGRPNVTKLRRTVHIADLSRPNAARAVEWVDASVVAIGQDSGLISLWDVRSSAGPASKSMRFQHPLCVYNLRCADTDGRTLVAAGPMWANCMYDLRMPREAVGSGWEDIEWTNPKDFSRLHHRVRNWSTPVVRYSDHVSSARPGGCAVSLDKGLLVLGTNDGTLVAYSLRQGKVVRLVSGDEPTPREGEPDPGEVSSCHFVDIDGADALIYTHGLARKILTW